MIGPRGRLGAALVAILVLVPYCVGCAQTPPLSPTPTPDYAPLETAVAVKLWATLTAKAPSPTHTLSPTPTATTRAPTPVPSATPTATPLPPSNSPLVAFVRVARDQTANIELLDVNQPTKGDVLTHFLEPLSISDVTWSKDGEWIVFVSAHDFIHSRNNERNIFMMRPNGTELRMITGEYVDPGKAPGPYVTLRGQVVGAKGTCLVCAQGAAKPVTADADGFFELPGVPNSAKWARAVCQDGSDALQGDIDLTAPNANPAALSIPVEPRGQGWNQVSLSRDGKLLAGIR